MSQNGNSIGVLSFISAVLGVTLLVGYILLGPSLIEFYYNYIFQVILVSAGLELVAIVLGFVSRASRLLAQHDISFIQYFIMGHPTEGVEDMLRYPDYALSSGRRKQLASFFSSITASS